MSRALYVPSQERIATTNLWAFQHWCEATARRPQATTGEEAWRDLFFWSAADPGGFCAALASFALQPEGAPAGPAQMSAVAAVLLHADIRPDDRVLIVGTPAGPWPIVARYGTELIAAGPTGPAAVLPLAAQQHATVLVAASGLLAEGAFHRRPERADLSRLRSIVAVGHPLAPQARARLYAWGKSDFMLLAQAGARLWGNPAGLVPLCPRPACAFFRPPPADREPS